MQVEIGIAFLLLTQQKLLEYRLLSLLSSQIPNLSLSLRTWHSLAACK